MCSQIQSKIQHSSETNILGILESLGYEFQDYGRNKRSSAVFRGGTNKTSLVVYDENHFIDFFSGEKGSLRKLVALTIKKDFKYTQKWLKEKGCSYQFVQPHVKIHQSQVFPQEAATGLVKEYSYWKSRGIEEETLKKFHGGVRGNGKLKDRFVFPILNSEKEIVGLAGRDLLNNPYNKIRPKWKILGDKKDFVYPLAWNLKQIREKGEVILVESIGDCLALFNGGIENVLVLFGLHLNASIHRILLTLNLNRVIVALNNDSDKGKMGNKASEKIKTELLGFFSKEKVLIKLPMNKKNDLGEMTKDEIKQWGNNL